MNESRRPEKIGKRDRNLGDFALKRLQLAIIESIALFPPENKTRTLPQ